MGRFIIVALLLTAGVGFSQPDVSWLVKPENRPRTGDRGPGVFHPSSVSGLRSFHDWNLPGENKAELQSPWVVYGAEFGLATVGTAIAAVGSLGFAHLLDPRRVVPEAARTAGLLTYALITPFLTAGGTHLAGKLLGQEGEFKHALLGAAIGDVLGILILHGSCAYMSRSGRVNLTPFLVVWLVLPPTCAVGGYNVWKGGNNGEW